ncbi:MAG: TolC family outer membrane protein [Rudaea sp.]
MIKPIRMTALALALALTCAALPAAAEDLMQIYQQARQADPTLAGADANKGAAEAGVGIARAPLLPQLGASLGYTHSDGGSSSISPQPTGGGNYVLVPESGTSRDRSRQAQGTLSQTLFNWADITRLRGARETAHGASANYDAAVQDLIVRTATAYFGVLTADDQLTFAKANEKALAKQLDQAEQRYKVGLSAITDVHEARANHDTAVAQVIQAQNALDTAREAVEQITGKDFGDLKKLRDDLPLVKPDPDNLQAWVDTALKQSPLLASSRFALNAARDNVSAQRAGHYPTLSASLVRTDTPSWGTRTSNFGSATLGSFPGNGLSGDTTIGVVLNVPIFTGGLVTAQLHQAVFQRDAAQDQLESTRRSIVAGTRNAYRAVLAGISEVEATKQAVISAQSALDATQAGFEVGTRTIVDVLLSQQQLFQAQSSYSQARHQFVLSGLQLKDAAGVLDGKDLEAVNTLLN